MINSLSKLIKILISSSIFILTQQQSNSSSNNTTSLTPPLNWDCVRNSIPREGLVDPSNCLKIADYQGWSCCHFRIYLDGIGVNVKELSAGGCIPVPSNISNNSTAYRPLLDNFVNATMNETIFVYTCRSTLSFFSVYMNYLLLLSFILIF
jgi:hypothetical protein